MDKQRDAEADYDRWKHAGSAIPFRYSFTGLFALVVIALTTWELWWKPPFREFGVAGGFFLLVGGCALFYDVPRRRLGVLSKGMLLLGFAIVGIMAVFKVIS